MKAVTDYQTDWPQSPGATIVSLAKSRGEILSALFEELGPEFIDVVRHRKRISPHLASSLEERLGGSRRFWLRRDAAFQKAMAESSTETEAEWVRGIPYADIANLGWLPKTRKFNEKLNNLYDFFGCDNLREWRNIYGQTLERVAFRTSFSFENDASATLSWLRMGDILAEKIDANEFDPDRLRSRLPELREQCRKASPNVFLPNVRQILSEVGVRFIVVRSPKGCRASGATRLCRGGQATLQMSFRYLSDDHFWFTFFHEIGHLVLHRDSEMFLEGDFVERDQAEIEANSFSAEILIPAKYRERLASIPKGKRDIMRFAFEIGVSPGILVGQMQHVGLIPHASMNFLKRRYKWG